MTRRLAVAAAAGLLPLLLQQLSAQAARVPPRGPHPYRAAMGPPTAAVRVAQWARPEDTARAATALAHRAAAAPSTTTGTAAAWCTPGQPCWPSPAQWAALNASVGGVLVAVAPPLAPCLGFAGEPPDAAACSAAVSNYSNSYWRAGQPGATQAVRIQYVGATTLDKSSTYTITVKQVPVKLPNDGKSGVQFVFNFSTVANIVPAGAKPVIETASVTPSGKTVKLTLKNNGNRYANLSTSTVELSGGTFKTVIKDDAWRKALGASWILPGGTRVIEIPKPDKAPATLAAKFTLVEPQN